MPRRSEELLAVVDKFNRVHDQWVADERRPHPDAIYWDALDELFTEFATGDIPADCREIAEAVAKLSEEMEIFDNRENPVAKPYPHEAFWSARDGLTRSQEPAVQELRPLESIKELHEQKVSHDQIALIYNLRHPNGELASHLVQRELDKPGSVIGPNWVDPRVTEQQKNRKTASTNIRAALQRKGDKAKAAAQPCPESPRDLWEQKVSIEQSARMLLKSQSEVAELFAGFDKEREEMLEQRKRQEAIGGPLPDFEGDAAGGVGTQFDPKAEQAACNAKDMAIEVTAEGDADHDIDQEIIELHREGHSTQAIKEATGIDGRKIVGVIRAYEAKEAEAATEEPATA